MSFRTDPSGPRDGNGTSSFFRIIIALVVILVLALLGRALNLPEYIRRAMEWIDSLGYGGVLLFILLYAVLSVLLVPGSISTLTAGAVFGVVQGTVYASLGSTLGATLAFLIGRYLARDAVQRMVSRKPALVAIDHAIRRDGWKLVGLLRLSPVVPWSMSNYFYGITAVRLGPYVIASWVGMLPGTIVYVYIGSVLGVGATTGMTTGQLVLTVAGIAATLIVMRMISRAVRVALRTD